MLTRIWRSAPVVIVEVGRELLPGEGYKTLLDPGELLVYGLIGEFGGEAFQRHRNQVLPRRYGHFRTVRDDRVPRLRANLREHVEKNTASSWIHNLLLFCKGQHVFFTTFQQTCVFCV